MMAPIDRNSRWLNPIGLRRWRSAASNSAWGATCSYTAMLVHLPFGAGRRDTCQPPSEAYRHTIFLPQHSPAAFLLTRRPPAAGRGDPPAGYAASSGLARSAWPASAPRARDVAASARLRHSPEQNRLVFPAVVSMKTPRQPGAWQTPNRSMPRSVSRTARPMTAPAAYRSATEPLSV